MFRRSKPQHIAPAAPTFEQIIEDLETFEIEKPELEPMRSLGTTSGSNIEQQAVDDETSGSANLSKPDVNQPQQLGQWMRTFETFRQDVSALHILRRQLQMGKTELDESREGIRTELDDLRRRVTDALDRSVVTS